METIRSCNACGQSIKEIKCDTCGDVLNQGVPITVIFDYPHPLAGVTTHFCCYGCLLIYIEGEKNK